MKIMGFFLLCVLVANVESLYKLKVLDRLSTVPVVQSSYNRRTGFPDTSLRWRLVQLLVSQSRDFTAI